MTDRENEEPSGGTELSNETLGLLIAAAVLAWFLIGLTYAIFVNY